MLSDTALIKLDSDQVVGSFVILLFGFQPLFVFNESPFGKKNIERAFLKVA